MHRTVVFIVMDIDLLDRRGRFVRLVAAATIGLGVTYVIMRLIAAATGGPKPDPISQVAPVVLAIAMFVSISWLAFAGLSKLKNRVR
jgi:hypothetical protein